MTQTTPPRTLPDVATLMRQVLYALLPGTALLLYLYGFGLLSNLILACLCAWGLEALMLHLRQRPLPPFLSDYSVIVTGWLLAVSLPACSPCWLILISMVFAVVIGKHLYGGLGQNPFNPAMLGYAAVLISFPLEMTRWPDPARTGFDAAGLDALLAGVFGIGSLHWDSLSGATPLDQVRMALHGGKSLVDSGMPLFSWPRTLGWNLLNLAWLGGGLWLLWQRVISWHIPVALLGSLTLFSGLFWLLDPGHYASPLFHLLQGATMLGAFFIATDPVTASTTPLGKILYAGGIGAFVYIIRTWGGYPDAMAFAVLIMNMAVPLLDHYTQPRVYGHRHRWLP